MSPKSLSLSEGTWSIISGACGSHVTAYRYAILRNGSQVASGTFPPNPATYTTATGDIDQSVTAQVTACDNLNECTTVNATGSYTPVLPPTNTSAPQISGTPACVGTQFTTTNGGWSSFSTITGHNYQWLSNGSPATGSGATTLTYTANAADAGHTLSVKVQAINAGGVSSWATSTTNNPKILPCNTAAPSFTPSGAGQDPSSGSLLFHASAGTWTGSPTSYTYNWYEGSTLLQSGATLTLAPICSRDGGQTLTLKVAATNAAGTSAFVAASTSASFIPCNTAAPTLTPDGTGHSVGETISVSNGTWAGATSYSYAWLRDGSVISGATGSSYTPVPGDVSHCISAKVTATNSSGSASATSSDSACVDNHLGPASDYTLWTQPIDDRESMSVNVGNGNLLLSASDLQLAGMAGFDLRFARSYNSLYSAGQDLATSLPATGWQTVASLHVASTGDVWYTDATGAESAFVKDGDGSYTPPAGVDAKLVKNSDGSYTLTFDGSNEQLNFNASGVLQSDVDANGNTISYSWSSGQLSQITDSLGRTTSFTYNGSGQLTTITDPGGRTYGYGYDENGNLASFTDPTNATTLYGYDSSGRLDQVTDPDGNMTQIGYNSSGQVSSVTSGLDSNGDCLPVGTTCPVTSFLYTQPGGSFCPSPSIETDVTDPKTHTTRYCSDSQLRTIGTMDPLGNPTSTSYTGGGSNCADDQPCSTEDADQNTTASAYDASKPQDLTSFTVTSKDGANSATQTATYDASSNKYLPSSSVDPNGNEEGGNQAANETNYTYNGSNLTSETDPSNDDTTQDAPTTTYTFDSHGRMTSMVSPNGNVAGCGCANQYTTSYSYYPSSSGNGAYLLESVTNPVGDETTYAYDALGRKVSEVDPNGNVSGGNPAAHTTTYTYDGDDRLLSMTDPLGHTTTYTYDGDGNQLSVTDGDGNTTTSTFNALNELTKTTKPDPDGSGPLTASTTTYAYDAAGNKTGETDPDNHTTAYGYDADNRLISQTDALGNETTYTYDGNGNLLTTVDPRGNVTGCGCATQYTTSNKYDETGRLVSTSDPLGNETTYTYDGNGNKLSMVDPRGNASGGTPLDHTTAYTYYPSGQVATVTTPIGYVTTYTYDADGNLLSRKDDNNHTTTYTYDNADELISITTPLGNKTTYTYDADGNKRSMVDANGNVSGGNPAAHTTTYGYDADNRLTSVSYSDGSTPNVTYGYDAAGNRTSMTDGSGTVNDTYDNDNELLTSTRGSDTFTYTYDPAGNTTSRNYPNGISATYDYNADEQLSSVTSGGQSTNYSYSPASELTQTDLPNGYVETRTYDDAGEVKDVDNARDGTVLSDFAYTLDPDGNPTKIVQTGAISSTTAYEYDNDNRLIDACYQATPCNEGPSSSDPYIHYTYDGVGNRLAEARPSGTTNYAYDADDELCATSTTGTPSCNSPTYTYDANGNETSNGSRTFSYDEANRLISTTSGGTTTTYVYDGDGNRLSATSGATTIKYLWDTNTALPQLALERSGGGSVLESYIYGIRRISMNSGGNPYYYLYDALGSVVNLTSSAGATEWTYSYEPFGGPRTATRNDPDAPDNPMQFTGGFLDSASGLYDLGAREEDPSDGRFLNEDPLPTLIGNDDSSPYAYTADQPTTHVDPSGADADPPEDAPYGYAAGAAEKVEGNVEAERGCNYIGCNAGRWNTDRLWETGNFNDPSDKGGNFTRVGRSIQKHSDIFGRADGGWRVDNERGALELQKILDDPKTKIFRITGGNFKGGRYYIRPNGIGATFSKDGMFRYFGNFR